MLRAPQQAFTIGRTTKVCRAAGATNVFDTKKKEPCPNGQGNARVVRENS